LGPAVKKKKHYWKNQKKKNIKSTSRRTLKLLARGISWLKRLKNRARGGVGIKKKILRKERDSRDSRRLGSWKKKG